MNVIRYAKSSILTVVLGAFAILMVGCASGGTLAAKKQVTAKDGTTFEGAWAAEFAMEYERAADPALREIFRDGKISDAELQSTTESFRSCLEQLGITDIVFSGPSRFTYFDPEILGDSAQMEKLVDACFDDTGHGPVARLYDETRTNPANKDQREDYVACLIRLGVVTQDFTLRDYDSAPPREWYSVPEEEGDVALDKCYADPEGAQK